MSISRKIFYFIFVLLILFFSFLMVKLTLPYLTFETDVDFLLTKQSIIHIKHWRWAFYTHIITSSFVLLFGVFQFSGYLLKKQKKIHRLLGKIYVIIVVFISGPAGLVMSVYANGGIYAKTSFVTLSLLWISFTALAWRMAMKKDFISHKNFMIRSYSLTLSAISLRLYAKFLPAFFHIGGKEEYILISWLSWTANLLIAEIIIFSIRKKPFQI